MPTAESEAEHVATPSFWISRKRKRGQTQPPSRHLNFPKLLDGEEPGSVRDLRRETFNKLWSEQDRVIQGILSTFNEKITNELSEFVKSPPERDETFNTIPSAFILAGSNIAGHARLFIQVKEQLKVVTQGPVIVISATEAPNLQTLLRKIISGCLEIELDDENDDEQATSKQVGLPGRIPYDLEILEEWYQSQQTNEDFRITIAFQDTEAFPLSLISDFILRNQARLSRLPVVLLFGVASTIEQFQLMLPTSVIKALESKIFKSRQNNECLRIIIDKVPPFRAILTKILMEDGNRLRLSHRVLKSLMDRYVGWNQSIEDFISGIKYAYMCHFYANPLSVLLASADPDILPTLLTKRHLDAVRSLPSVRHFVEDKLAENETAEVRAILSDDVYLASDLIPHFIGLLHDKAREMRHTLLVLEKLAERHPNDKRGLSKLYLGVLNEKVEEDNVPKFSSMNLVAFLASCIEVLPTSSEIRQRFEGYVDEIEEILAEDSIREPSAAQINQKQTLISEYDIQERPGMRNTKVSQKLRQEKDRANMTREDEEYTKLVEEINDYLKDLFAKLSPPTSIPLSEVFYFNTTKTHADVFKARPREVLKRAFCHPADYLNCTCCKKDSDTAAIRSTQPATSILYELYLDSATGLINLYDLFGAFCQVQEGKEGDGEEQNEEQMLASFMASLDELVWIGYAKKSFKKTDHVEKLVGE